MVIRFSIQIGYGPRIESTQLIDINASQKISPSPLNPNLVINSLGSPQMNQLSIVDITKYILEISRTHLS